MNMEEKVVDIVVRQLDVLPELVVPSARFSEDLGADSLDAIELAMAVEEEFNIEISDEDLEKIATVGQMIEYLRGRGMV